MGTGVIKRQTLLMAAIALSGIMALGVMTGCGSSSSSTSNDQSSGTQADQSSQSESTAQTETSQTAPVSEGTAQHPVIFTVNAPNYDGATCTRIPLAIVGTQTDGTAVSQTAYIDGQGKGLDLAAGTYTATVIASPLLADGSLYNLPVNNVISIVIPDNLAKDESYTVSSDSPIAFTVCDAASVTDDQIAAAYNAAAADSESASKADSLRDTATAHRDTALQARTDDEFIHVDSDYFYFDIPGSWGGSTVVTERIDGQTVYHVDDPDGTALLYIGIDGSQSKFDMTYCTVLQEGTTAAGEKVTMVYYDVARAKAADKVDDDKVTEVNTYLTSSAEDLLKASFQTK